MRKYAKVETGMWKAAKDFEMLSASINEDFSEPFTDKIAREILKRSQHLVPVQTGALKASGRIVMSRRAISKYRRAKEVRYGNLNVQYAGVVEYGRTDFAPFPPRAYLRTAVFQTHLRMKTKALSGKGQMTLALRKRIRKVYIP